MSYQATCWLLLSVMVSASLHTGAAKGINVKVNFDVSDGRSATTETKNLTTDENRHVQRRLVIRHPDPLQVEYDLSESIVAKLEEIEIVPKLKENIEKLHEIRDELRTAVQRAREESRVPDVVGACAPTPAPGVAPAAPSAFRPLVVPEWDALDDYSVNTTGCKYEGLNRVGASDYRRGARVYDGERWRVDFAVRGPEHAHFNLWWGEPAANDYLFYVGDGYEVKQLHEHAPSTLLRRRAAPVLAADRYERFYLRLDRESLSFGRHCDAEPIFKREVRIERGSRVFLRFRAYSFYGAKFLYDCPASFSAADQ